MKTNCNREDVLKLLKSLDHDKSGKVSSRELMTMFDDAFTHEELKAFIARYDKDGDGELDIDELVHFLTK